MSIPDDLITPKEAARLLRCHLASVYRWIGEGKLAAWKRLGHRILVSHAAVERLLQPVEARETVTVPEAAPDVAQERYEAAIERLKRQGCV